MNPTSIPPNDGVIRHLNVALDTVRMKALLQERMFRGSVARIRRCKIERIKYKRGKNCLVCYRLDIDSANAELGQDMRLSARFYEARGSHSRYRNESKISLAQPDRVAPLLHLPELDLPFTHKSKLKKKRMRKCLFPLKARLAHQYHLAPVTH